MLRIIRSALEFLRVCWLKTGENLVGPWEESAELCCPSSPALSSVGHPPPLSSNSPFTLMAMAGAASLSSP